MAKGWCLISNGKTRTHNKTLEADQPPAGNKKFRRIGEDVRITMPTKTTPQRRSIQDTTPAVTVSSQPYTYLTEKIHTKLHINSFTQ